jgi:chromosome partitioning protein
VLWLFRRGKNISNLIVYQSRGNLRLAINLQDTKSMSEEGQHPKVLMVAQQKGGVGKTTIAKMLGIYGAREDLANKRVLLIDMDYQASLSKLMIQMEHSNEMGTQPPIHPGYNPQEDPDWNGRSSSADIFFDGIVFPYPIQFPYPVENLELLPAHKARLQLVEEQDRTKLREKVHNRLHEFLSKPEVCESYDLIIIDTGPKESPLVRSSLRAASHMIVPVTLETQCIDGLAEMLALWRTERASRPSMRPLTLSGLVVNRFDARYSTHQAYLAQLSNDERISGFLSSTIIPQRAAVTERDARGSLPATLFDLPNSADIREIALELCHDVFTSMLPDEAKHFAKLKPDRKYISLAAKALAKVNSREENTPEAPAPEESKA